MASTIQDPLLTQCRGEHPDTTMAIDTSGASGCIELFYLSVCAYIETVMRSIGIRKLPNNHESSSSFQEESYLRNKTDRIEACLGTTSPVDLWELRELALSEGGLMRGTFRFSV